MLFFMVFLFKKYITTFQDSSTCKKKQTNKNMNTSEVYKAGMKDCLIALSYGYEFTLFINL